MTWWESNDHCLGAGGRLVEIDSAEENTALAEEISREYPDRSINFWMGLRDAQREGDWRLASNGLEPSFLNWHPGQPDNYENEDCAWFRTGSNVSNVWEKQWFDIKCNANANFGPFPIFLHALCEFEPPTGHLSTEDTTTESTTEGESIQNGKRIQDIIFCQYLVILNVMFRKSKACSSK